MSIHPNATEQGMINSTTLAEQQKNWKATKIKYRILKQTHDKKLAESFKTIAKKLERWINLLKN